MSTKRKFDSKQTWDHTSSFSVLSINRMLQVGKNKRISKGKKGGKKKAQDPFARKDWYDVKAPSMFTQRSVGKTLVTRTTGTKVKSPARNFDALRKAISKTTVVPECPNLKLFS